MIHFGTCNICGHIERVNGIINCQFAMDKHIKNVHPKEYNDMREHNGKIEAQITKLRSEKIHLYTIN